MYRSTLERLEKLLSDLGFAVPVDAIRPVQGYWKRQDVYRWEARLGFEGREVSVCSWDTVSDCVRYGIELHRDSAYEFEITCKKQA